jgi:hypothetical protein
MEAMEQRQERCKGPDRLAVVLVEQDDRARVKPVLYVFDDL